MTTNGTLKFRFNRLDHQTIDHTTANFSNLVYDPERDGDGVGCMTGGGQAKDTPEKLHRRAKCTLLGTTLSSMGIRSLPRPPNTVSLPLLLSHLTSRVHRDGALRRPCACVAPRRSHSARAAAGEDVLVHVPGRITGMHLGSTE